MKENLKEKFNLYFLSFFIYCILGWIYEVVLGLIYGHGFVNWGFLFGPYLPVYGFGALLLVFCLYKLKGKKIRIGKISITPVIIFLLIVLITTIVEYITGYALEMIFHKRWWDYSNDWLNLNGYVCPRTSFRFGLGGMLFLYVLQPLFDRFIPKVSMKTQNVLVIGIVICMGVDLITTLFF